MSATSAEIVSVNPASPDDVVTTVMPAGGIEVDRAVERAAAAARGYARTPAAARGAGLAAVADALEARSQELAALVVREVGKPITEARGELARAVAILRFYAQVALDPDGESFPPADGRSLLLTRREPRGVVGLITPWNFPVAIPLWKLAPALAYGNVCVWKPSEHAPACAAAVFELLRDALPDGAVELTQGARRGGRGAGRASGSRGGLVHGVGGGRSRGGGGAGGAGRGCAVRDGRPERGSGAGRRRRRGGGRHDRVGRDGLRRPEVHGHRPGDLRAAGAVGHA